MNCVFYENMAPDSFEENFFYSKEMPYTIFIKQFQIEDIVPLHYAKTIEILICDNLTGSVLIDGNEYQLRGKQIFVIPPYIVHSTSIMPCKGTQHVFKVSFLDMEQYINIANYLNICGCSYDQFEYTCDEFDAIMSLIKFMITHDGDMGSCLPAILEIFHILSMHVNKDRVTKINETSRLDLNLRKIISWTQKNYMNRVVLDDVAAVLGYSKYYFCNTFKKITGTTYKSYLNSVRVSNACLMLQEGYSVQEVCTRCGFENVSYFVQVFKKFQHITPYQYANKRRISISK